MWSCRMVLFPQPAIYRLFSHFNPLPPLYCTLYSVHCQLYSYIYIFNNIYSAQGYLENSIMYMYCIAIFKRSNKYFLISSNYSTRNFLTVSYLPFSCMGSLLIWEVSQIFFIKNNPAHLAEVPQGDST